MTINKELNINQRQSKRLPLQVFGAFVGVAILASTGGHLASATDDDTVIDVINATVPVACTISGSTDHTYSTSMLPDTTETLGPSRVKSVCNDVAGYSLYAIGFTGDSYTGDNNKLVGSLANINTGTSGPDSYWAMKAEAITGDYAPTIMNSFDNYHAIPADFAQIARFTSVTDGGTIGSNLDITYQVHVSRTQTADTYTGKVKYVLVHPNNAPVPANCNPGGTTISTIVCMQDITSTNKSTVMVSMTTGTQYTLKDKRDGKEYKIAKLADGKVWMTQNLDLDIDTSITYTNEDTDLGWNTSTNSYQAASWTPIRPTYTTATNNIHAWCQGGTWNSQYGYCENNNTPESYDPGNLYWNTTTSNWTDWGTYYDSCDFSTSIPSCNESLNPLSTYVSSTGTAQYHLGNYYNWAAAIASNDASVYGVYNENTGEYENLETHQSICPAGWTLPYADLNNSLGQFEGNFVDLWTEYGWTENDGFSDISTIWSAPLYFAPVSYFNGYFEYVGASGNLWSSVVVSDTYSRGAAFNVSGGAGPIDGGDRGGGFSIRCLLR